MQQRRSGSSRSSVGTVTTLSNSLRMLFSRAGDYPDRRGAARLGRLLGQHPGGACPHCHGVGVTFAASEASLVPDPSLSIRDGAVAAWPGAWLGKNFRDILATLGYDIDRPWRDLTRPTGTGSCSPTSSRWSPCTSSARRAGSSGRTRASGRASATTS